jgi:Icc-related predicted phosphoesterase
LAGDWHGNIPWARKVIEQMPSMPGKPKLILHAGDFGLWPGDSGERYLKYVTAELNDIDAQLWFVDGNHEDHVRLTRTIRDAPQPDPHNHKHEITERIWWLPRGYRWTWHDRTWLALGGATSVDRAVRTPGVDWFGAERIRANQEKLACEPGHADAMITHDCPNGVPMNLPPPPSWWELGPAEQHRQVMRRVVEHVQPELLVHGHYHLFHDSKVDFDHGTTRVIGLDCDGTTTADNTVVLDTRTLETVTS